MAFLKSIRQQEKFHRHIYRQDDGRGEFDVFLNGRQISEVTYVDTLHGVIKQLKRPIQFLPSGKPAMITRTGHVEVFSKTKKGGAA